jgi:signal transduction histidine kinase
LIYSGCNVGTCLETESWTDVLLQTFRIHQWFTWIRVLCSLILMCSHGLSLTFVMRLICSFFVIMYILIIFLFLVLIHWKVWETNSLNFANFSMTHKHFVHYSSMRLNLLKKAMRNEQLVPFSFCFSKSSSLFFHDEVNYEML